MRTSWGIAVAVASLLVASSALAQGRQPPGSQSPPPSGQKSGQQQGQQQGQQRHQQQANKQYEATKHIAVINAGLKDAQTNAQMLAQISSDKRTYDKMHGEVFFKNIRESVTQAEGHLSHLQPLATTDNEKKQVQELSKSITTAKQMFQPMASKLDDAQSTNDSAKKLEKQFTDAMSPLKQVAQEMNSSINIG